MMISKHDNIKNEKEIRNQKIIIQSQFRQNELEKLIDIIEKPFDTDGVSNKDISMMRIAKSSSMLNSFLNQKQYLFPILKDDKYRNLGNLIIETFEEILKVLEENELELNNSFKDLINKYDYQRNEFIHSLQAFILIELEK